MVGMHAGAGYDEISDPRLTGGGVGTRCLEHDRTLRDGLRGRGRGMRPTQDRRTADGLPAR